MPPWVPHTRSCTNCNEKHETHNTMWTSRCCNGTTLEAQRIRKATAAVSIRWRFSYGLCLLLLTLLAGEMIAPVHGGLADFSPPGIIQYGTCAQPKDHASFRYDEFAGLWYQVEMVANNYMEAKKCITLDFRWDGVEYNVTTLGLNEYSEMVTQDATITLVEPEDPATMKPYLQIWAPGVPPVPYHVVKTNYRHFACVYSCYELFSLMFEVFSVLSRGPEINDADLATCHRAFDSLELDITRLAPVQQTGECDAMDIQGSGAGPEHQDEEEEEEDDENALAALTSEEVNQRQPPNRASAPRSDLATGEEETMIEEMEDLLEEIEGGGRRGGGRGGRRGGGEALSSSQTRNGSVGDAAGDLSEESVVGSVKPATSHQRPDKGRRRRPSKAGQQRRKGEVSAGKTEDSFELYIDDPSLDLFYHEATSERGGHGKGEHADKDEERAVMTHGSEPLGSGGDGSPGRIPAPAALLLLALLSLSLWPRVSARP